MRSVRWNIYFLNVGDGDCIFLADSSYQHCALIDAGPRDPSQGGHYPYRLSAAEFLATLGVHEIDLFISTHFHEDHAGGLPAVIDNIKIRQFWCNYYPPEFFWDIPCEAGPGWRREAKMMVDAVKDFQTTLHVLQCKNIPVSVVGDGLSRQIWQDVLVTGYYPGEAERSEYELMLKTLHTDPTEANFCQAMKTLNSISLVLCFEICKSIILLPSDPSSKCINSHRLRPCSLLKLAHHGGDDGSSMELLKHLSPQQIVITASKDSPEFPGKKTLSLLAELCGVGAGFILHPVDISERPYLHFEISEEGCKMVS